MKNELKPDDYALLQTEPVDFIELAFGDSLWGKQQAIARSVCDQKYTVVRSSHGVGKSFISARISLWFLYAFPNSKVITTAPTFRQVTDILWREIHTAKNHAHIPLGGKLNDTSLDLGDQWFAMGLSTNEPDRFQGYHSTDLLLIVDEASGVAEDIFNASEGIVSSQHARVLYIGNPTTTSGTFYNSFKLPGYSKIHISAFDTPNFTEFGITLEDIRNNTWEAKITRELPRPYLITPEWVYDKFLRWGEGTPMWDSRVMGEFPTEGEDTLIPMRYVEDAATKHLEPAPDDPKRIGVDVARKGNDKTVFLRRDGPKVLEMKVYTQADTMLTAQRVADYAGLYLDDEIAVDSVGIGAGAYDRLVQLLEGRQLYGVNVGKAAFKPERFFNLRSEIFFNLRERFVQGDIDLSTLPPDQLEELTAQLTSMKFTYTRKGQIQLESKDDMKARGLCSPDMADALAMAYGRLHGNVQFFAMPVYGTPTAEPGVTPSAAPIPQPAPQVAEDERKRLEREADLAAIREQRGW